jgi:hypothetical protein
VLVLTASVNAVMPSAVRRKPCAEAMRARISPPSAPPVRREESEPVELGGHQNERVDSGAALQRSGAWRPATPGDGRKVRRVSPALKEELATRARERGLSLNATLVELLECALKESAQEAAGKDLEAALAASARELERSEARRGADAAAASRCTRA